MKIGELAHKSGCSIQTIRFYEKEGLLPAPDRSAGNFRLYDTDTLEQLSFVKHCRDLDLNLAEVRDLINLQQSPEAGCEDIIKMIDSHILQVDTRIKTLRKLKSQLQALRHSCDHHKAVKECGILKGLKQS